MHISCLFIFLAAQRSIGTGNSDGQLGWSFQWLCGSWRKHCEQSLHSKMCCTSGALQAPRHCGLGTSEATGEHVLCFLVAPVNSFGHQDLTLESSVHPMTLGFRQLCLILTYGSDWCWMNFLILFLMVLGFNRGLRAAMMPSKRWLKNKSFLRITHLKENPTGM